MTSSFGLGSSPSTTCKSVRQTPQAATLTRISPGPGCRSASSVHSSGDRGLFSTIACISFSRFGRLHSWSCPVYRGPTRAPTASSGMFFDLSFTEVPGVTSQGFANKNTRPVKARFRGLFRNTHYLRHLPRIELFHIAQDQNQPIMLGEGQDGLL